MRREYIDRDTCNLLPKNVYYKTYHCGATSIMPSTLSKRSLVQYQFLPEQIYLLPYFSIKFVGELWTLSAKASLILEIRLLLAVRVTFCQKGGK